MSGRQVSFLSNDGTEVVTRVEVGENVLHALRRVDPTVVEAPCGGAGTCGKCRVRVLSGDVGAPDAEELRRLSAQDRASGIRLACRLNPISDLTLSAADAGKGSAVIRESFSALSGRPDPRITEKDCYGVAIDIGTTTIAAYLIEYVPADGSPARVIASASVLNRQRAFGADVIARIDYSIKEADGLAELASLVRADVCFLIDELLAKGGAKPESLREISVVGNTTMLHLFACVDPAGIAVAPFTPAFIEARRGPAAEYGLPYARAQVILGPSVAGYVGADLVAAARAVDLDGREKTALILDLGTNGEMALGDKRGVIACATAAGPAFEGASISCGLGGVAGAIDGLFWRPDGRLTFTTIADLPPIGVCGSGIIDAAACLVRGGIIDDTGAMDDPWKGEGYPLARFKDGIFRFTQADVRQIQLAKAAVAGGIAVMLRELGVSYDDVDAVFLAGGFGSYLKPDSAAVIGLLPAELLSKVETVGNAAGHGAVRLLLFKDELERASRFAREIRYVELSSSSYFSERYVEEMFFPAPGAVLSSVVPASFTEGDERDIPTGGGASS
ncbi:MAG: ASKHA domain-containing protein [Treponemataceae bacterium]